jgi:hypothetical protein
MVSIWYLSRYPNIVGTSADISSGSLGLDTSNVRIPNHMKVVDMSLAELAASSAPSSSSTARGAGRGKRKATK